MQVEIYLRKQKALAMAAKTAPPAVKASKGKKKVSPNEKTEQTDAQQTVAKNEDATSYCKEDTLISLLEHLYRDVSDVLSGMACDEIDPTIGSAVALKTCQLTEGMQLERRRT